MRRWICYCVAIMLFPVFALAMHQVNYLGQLPVDSPVAVVVDETNTLYVVRSTGSSSGVVTIFNQTTGAAVDIGGKEKEWKDILRHPTGVALYGDRLYVTDAGLDRIAVFSRTGRFLESYGSKGSGPGEFADPAGLFVYKGVIYVADTGNNRIQLLGENGVFLSEVGPSAELEKRLEKPIQVAVDPMGRVYAVTARGQIKVYAADGSFTQAAPFVSVSAIRIDREGIFVADGAGLSIKKYGFSFEPMFTFGARGSGRAQFLEISSLFVTRDGEVYVADSKAGRIQIFLPESGGCVAPLAWAPPPTSARWTGTTATDPVRDLSRIVVKDDTTFLAVDAKSGAICVFEKGRQTGEIQAGKDVVPESVAFDASGGLYVLARGQVIKLGKEGRADYTFGVRAGASPFSAKPDDMAITVKGAVCVTDRKEKTVKIYNTDGVFLRSISTVEGQVPLIDPMAIAVDDQGRLLVLDAGHKSVFRFDTDGTRQGGFAVGDTTADPVDMTVFRDHVYVLDGKGCHVKLFSSEGRLLARFGASGSTPGNLDRPVSIAAKNDAAFLVLEPRKNRVQSFAVIYTPDPPNQVTAAGGARSVSLQWEKSPSRFVETYNVYRTPQNGGRAQEAIARTLENSYVDTSVTPGESYFYTVTAAALAGNESALSAPAFATAEKLTADPPAAVTAAPQDFSVDLAWQPSASAHLAEYIVYRNKEEVARVRETAFTDTGLAPETEYVYDVASVSVDGVVSAPVSATVTTRVTTRPPVEIDVLELSNIFSNTYKTYETNGIGKIHIRNNTKDLISRLNVLFTIKNFMDFPSETVLTDLGPGKGETIPLKAVFNDKILEVTEDTPVQTEITASYYVSGQLKTFAVKQSINVYEKHKMTWDDPHRIGAFVTTKDPVVMEFVRGVTTQYDHTADPLISAALIFDAMGAAGIRYTRDPSNSYQETKENTELVDYLQYPRETLQRKSGDCDDLVILYAAALESVGINTRFVEVPGHIFMMFDFEGGRRLGTDTMNDLLVIEDGRVWIPVEVTKVGRPFSEAWEAGSRNYYKWKGTSLSTLNLHDAWAAYKPANLPVSSFRVEPVSRQALDKRFDNEFNVIRKTSIKIQNREFFARLQSDPADNKARMQLGIAYAKYGVLDEALSLFNMILKKEPANAAVLNNVGNIHFLEKAYAKAVAAYTKAAAADTGDPLVRVNLAMALLKNGQKTEAKKAFAEACRINPDIAKQYRSLELQLIGSK
ncbi:MAG: fibronectin type III domain-containing protein [Thermodesulfobacteriota bacterium]